MTCERIVVPARGGLRPRTTSSNPHVQFGQQQSDDRARAELREHLDRLPDVVWEASGISVPGARALTLSPGGAAGPTEAFMAGTEFAHLHPAPDYSLHMRLPEDVAGSAIEAGWAEQHPMAVRGLIPPNTVMVYAPRDSDEVAIVARLVRLSYDYASGTSAAPPSIS